MSSSLFDSYRRSDRSGAKLSESEFAFLNRSAWKWAGFARATLETWFADVPPDKRADIRNSLRGDDRQYASALLELTTHQILRALAQNVEVEPALDGGRPDFSAEFSGRRFIVECIVAQESDREFGALRREQTILDVVNLIETGPFRLVIQPQRIGENQPPARELRRFLDNWLASLISRVSKADYQDGDCFGPVSWRYQDWEVYFSLVFVGSASEKGAIGVIKYSAQDVVNDSIISRALERKADRYRTPQAPYLIVVSERHTLAGPEAILDTLFGPIQYRLGSSCPLPSIRVFNGFWGSPARPRKTHVSAVLYKRRMAGVQSICGQRKGGIGLQPIPEWLVAHNPYAAKPLPEGTFPFAVEHVWSARTLKVNRPRLSLNEVLRLPDPWPGEER